MNEKQTRGSVGENGDWEEKNTHGYGAPSEGGTNGCCAKEAMAKKIELTHEQEGRFWKKVDKSAGPDACWLWTAGKFGFGYGAFYIGAKLLKAHRIAWTLTNGQIPHDGSYHGTCVLHRCDVPSCCNPAHLFLGTNADNMVDKTIKGRNNSASGDRNGSRTKPERVARGEVVGASKLTSEQVLGIRKLYSSEKITQRELAALFGVSQGVISLIICRKIWTHI